MTGKISVAIDRDLCIGSGTCEAIDASVFQVGDDGIAYLVDESPSDEEILRRAEQSCPSGAIRVDRANGDAAT